MCSLLECACNEHEEKPPCCVYFELSGSRRKGEDRIHLTINFQSHRHSTPLGDIDIHIRRCTLQFDIQNGEMPLNKRAMLVPLKAKVEKAWKTSSGAKDGKTLSASGEATAGVAKDGPSFGMKSTASKSSSNERTTSVETSFTVEHWQILPAGRPSQPEWVFADKQGQGELVGGLNSELLGVLVRRGSTCHIDAKVTAYPRDLEITGRSGLIPTDINASNKLVRHLLILRLLKSDLRPFLNRKCFEVK